MCSQRHLGLRSGFKLGKYGPETLREYLGHALRGYPELREKVLEQVCWDGFFRTSNSITSHLFQVTEEDAQVMLSYVKRLHAFYCLRLLVAPFIEDAILLDRIEYLR